jgi:hypothetical protein
MVVVKDCTLDRFMDASESLGRKIFEIALKYDLTAEEIWNYVDRELL